MIQKAKITSKGQITLPAPIREALGLEPGDKVAFLPGLDGEFRLRKVSSIEDLFGALAGDDAPKTNAELDDLLAAYATELDEATKSSAETPGSEAA